MKDLNTLRSFSLKTTLVGFLNVIISLRPATVGYEVSNYKL